MTDSVQHNRELPPDIRTISDLESQVELLAQSIGSLYAGGRSGLREAQQNAQALTRMQLILNDLERREICENMPTRAFTVRCMELRTRILSIRDELDRQMRRRRRI
ncbi:MAG: hypothetical protein OEW15_17355 [Nitrospirota bacterium]|nr:hypothetical protein [Nitrospirota bacterium]